MIYCAHGLGQFVIMKAMNEKGFTAVAIILMAVTALVVIGGIWYYAIHKTAIQTLNTTSAPSTVTTTPTSSWKTYVFPIDNPYWGTAQMNYPADWHDESVPAIQNGAMFDILYQPSGTCTSQSLNFAASCTPSPLGEISMWFDTGDDLPSLIKATTSFEGFVREFQSIYLEGYLHSDTSLSASTTVDGHEAISILIPQGVRTGDLVSMKSNMIEFINVPYVSTFEGQQYTDSNYIDVYVAYAPGYEDYVLQTFNRILATFQFGQSTSTTP